MVLQSADQSSALFIHVEAPPIAKLETKIPVQEHFSPRLVLPRVLYLSLLAGGHQTKPGGLALHYSNFYAGPGPGQQAAALPGRHATILGKLV